MAKMGKRNLVPIAPPDVSPEQNKMPAANLIISPFLAEPITTLGVEPSFLGVPIMREGFVTETGFLVGSN